MAPFAIAVAVVLAPPTLTARAAGQAATPVVVAPGRCAVERRPAADFAAIAAATQRPREPPASSSPMGTPTPLLAPPDVVAGVAATMAAFAACTNAGEAQRSLALFSDDLLAALFGGMSGADLAALMATPTAAVPLEDPIAEVVVEEVRLLPDGRVAATVRFDGVPSRAVLVRVGDRYLIDAVDDAADEATPAP